MLAAQGSATMAAVPVRQGVHALLSDHRLHTWLAKRRLYDNKIIQRVGAESLLEFQVEIEWGAGQAHGGRRRAVEGVLAPGSEAVALAAGEARCQRGQRR